MLKKILMSIAALVILILALSVYFYHKKGSIVWVDSSEDMFLKVEEVVSGLGVPWGMDFLDEGTIIFTERSGNIGILDLNSGNYELINKPPNVFLSGQCGLLDVKVSPTFSKNNIVYFTYAKNIDGYGYTSLATATLVNNQIQNWEDIFISRGDPTKNGVHCGSRITFDEEGHVFVSLGNRGTRGNAQDTSTHAGSIIRLNLDGSTPPDNPFDKDEKALSELWSIGHRNPQGLYYDSLHKRLWSNEHGPRGGDEVNLIEPGLNYGWPVITYGREYEGPRIGEGEEKSGMERPLKIWRPSIAPSSILYYTGASFPGWNANLFSTSLAQQHINRLVIDSTGRIISEERLLEEVRERFRAILQDQAGNLYISTDSGRILKISPTDCTLRYLDMLYIRSIHCPTENYRQWELSKHIDRPGVFFGFSFNFMYSYGNFREK